MRVAFSAWWHSEAILHAVTCDSHSFLSKRQTVLWDAVTLLRAQVQCPTPCCTESGVPDLQTLVDYPVHKDVMLPILLIQLYQTVDCRHRTSSAA